VRYSTDLVWIFLLGFLGSTQSTAIAMITIVRSRGLLYAILRQTEKAKIDRQQAAIIFRQQNNMATYEKVMQLLRELGRWQMIKTAVDLYRRGNDTSPRMDHVRPKKNPCRWTNTGGNFDLFRSGNRKQLVETRSGNFYSQSARIN
jgi:hypothetical protein